MHVQPGASRSGVVGIYGHSLKISVRARASEGAANKAVCELLGALLDLPPSRVSIHRGARSRTKAVRVEGLAKEAVAERITALLPV